jgi:hypothetical protein
LGSSKNRKYRVYRTRDHAKIFSWIK